MRRPAGSLFRAVCLCAAVLGAEASHVAGAAPHDGTWDGAVVRKGQVATPPKLPPRALDLPDSGELRALACAEALLIDPAIGPEEAAVPAPPCAPESMRLDPELPTPTRGDLEDHALPVGMKPVAELSGEQIADTARVARYVKFFAYTAQGRAIARRWLQRVVADAGPVRQALAEAGLPASYVAIPVATSGLVPDATWKLGGAGAWGFAATEARTLGLEVAPTYDERRDLAHASNAASHRLIDLRMRYGSWPLVVAALDIGEATLDAACETAPGAHSCEGVALSQIAAGALPRGTLRRVARVAAVALLIDNLGLFGFDDVRAARGASTTLFDVPVDTPLRILARASGTSVQALHALNPALLGDRVVGHEPTHEVRIPSGGRARADAMLPRLLAGDGDGAETLVDDGFDWGRPDLEVAAPTKTNAKKHDDKRPDPRSTTHDVALATPVAPRSSPIVVAELAPKVAYSKVRPWPLEGDVTAFRVAHARTLDQIAALLRVSAKELALLNGVGLSGAGLRVMLPVGTWLRVPAGALPVDAPRRRHGQPRTERRAELRADLRADLRH